MYIVIEFAFLFQFILFISPIKMQEIKFLRRIKILASVRLEQSTPLGIFHRALVQNKMNKWMRSPHRFYQWRREAARTLMKGPHWIIRRPARDTCMPGMGYALSNVKWMFAGQPICVNAQNPFLCDNVIFKNTLFFTQRAGNIQHLLCISGCGNIRAEFRNSPWWKWLEIARRMDAQLLQWLCCNVTLGEIGEITQEARLR